jgi:hypothetical protein
MISYRLNFEEIERQAHNVNTAQLETMWQIKLMQGSVQKQRKNDQGGHGITS